MWFRHYLMTYYIGQEEVAFLVVTNDDFNDVFQLMSSINQYYGLCYGECVLSEISQHEYFKLRDYLHEIEHPNWNWDKVPKALYRKLKGHTPWKVAS